MRNVIKALTVSVTAVAVVALGAPAQADTAWEFASGASLSDTAWE